MDQIRTIVKTFRDKLPVDMFPGRTLVPKTLVFAKDDSHAEDIVRIMREEFGKGDEFCQKITYKVSWKKPEDLISDFRNSYFPRIAVTVDMIATGTDIRPLEILLFMRAVRSRLLYEQMLGRGTRVVSPTELQNVTSDATLKDHFVIVDAVGLTEQELMDPQTLERKPSATFKQLLEAVALGVTDEATLSSLAGRLDPAGKTPGSRPAGGDPGTHRRGAVGGHCPGAAGSGRSGQDFGCGQNRATARVAPTRNKSRRRRMNWRSRPAARWQPTRTCGPG